jgi:hypothetical protein
VPRNIFHVIALYYLLMILSVIYLVGLTLAFPFWLIVLLVSIVVVSLLKWYRPALNLVPEKGRFDWFPAIVLAAILAIVIYKAYPLEEKYGIWDAWWFWDVRANFLSGQSTWRAAFSAEQYGTPFTVPVAHSDYPPFLPLVIGSVWRALGMQSAAIPFAFSMLSLLLIPASIFWALYPENKIIAIVMALFFTTQPHCILLACSQTADGLIALFTLLSGISWHYFRKTGNKQCIVLTGAMLGLSLWTKNEGMIITFLFVVFMLPSLLRSARWKYFLLGIAVPMMAFIVFKLCLAPPNDLYADQSGVPWDKIKDFSRYSQILTLTWDQIRLYFPAIPYLAAAYLLLCLLKRSRPDRLMWMILACLAAYLAVFVITPHNLEWHVNSSVNRLIFQLIPSFIWLAGSELAKALRQNNEV